MLLPCSFVLYQSFSISKITEKVLNWKNLDFFREIVSILKEYNYFISNKREWSLETPKEVSDHTLLHD